MKFYSAIKRNEAVSFAETQMDLETVYNSPITPYRSEVSQKGKNEYHILIAHMCNIEKWYRGTYLQGRNRDTEIENKCMDSKGPKTMWDELGLTYIHY